MLTVFYVMVRVDNNSFESSQFGQAPQYLTSCASIKDSQKFMDTKGYVIDMRQRPHWVSAEITTALLPKDFAFEEDDNLNQAQKDRSMYHISVDTQGYGVDLGVLGHTIRQDSLQASDIETSYMRLIFIVLVKFVYAPWPYLAISITRGTGSAWPHICRQSSIGSQENV